MPLDIKKSNLFNVSSGKLYNTIITNGTYPKAILGINRGGLVLVTGSGPPTPVRMGVPV